MFTFLRSRLMLVVSAALLLSAAPLRAADVYEGILQVVWQDPRPGATLGGETRYSLALADGRIIDLQMNGLESTAITLMGASVVVTGQPGAPATNGRASVAGGVTVAVDTIAPAQGFAARDSSTSTVASGTKKVIFVLLKFSDDTAVPHAAAFYTNLTNPDTAPAGQGIPSTINAFFKKTSNNQFSWIADVGGAGGIGAPGGWITLPQPKSYYAPCDFSVSCANLTTLTNDAVAAAKAQGIVFTSYDNINFVFSNDLDCCATGGSCVHRRQVLRHHLGTAVGPEDRHLRARDGPQPRSAALRLGLFLVRQPVGHHEQHLRASTRCRAARISRGTAAATRGCRAASRATATSRRTATTSDGFRRPTPS